MRGSALMSPLYDWPTGLGQIIAKGVLGDILVFRNTVVKVLTLRTFVWPIITQLDKKKAYVVQR